MQIDLKSCFLGMERLAPPVLRAVLIDAAHTPLAQGEFTWENRLQNGIWTYPMEEVRQGVQAAYAALAADVRAKHGTALPAVGCIGVSAMMQGYRSCLFHRMSNVERLLTILFVLSEF